MKTGYYASGEYINVFNGQICHEVIYGKTLQSLNKKANKWLTHRINPVWTRRIKSRYMVTKIK
jgi:hypothetical protein